MGTKTRKEIVAGQGFYYMPSAYVTLKVTVEGRYSHEKMERAVRLLEEAHPLIHHVVRKSGSKMWFEDAGKHVTLKEYDELRNITWEAAIRKMVYKPINLLETPGVMIGVVIRADRFYLMVVCQHMYGDGMSVKLLMEDLIYAYRTGEVPAKKRAYPELSEKDLPEAYRIPDAVREGLLAVSKKCEEKQVEFTWEDYKQMIETHNASTGYGLVCRNIKKPMFLKLREKCKELGVTIGAAVSTAIAGAMLQGDAIEAIISVDTRNLFGSMKEDELANYASCIKPLLSYDRSLGFWDNVVIIDRCIKEKRTHTEEMLATLYTFMLLSADAFGAAYYARYGMFRDMEVLGMMRNALSLSYGSENFELSNLKNISFEEAAGDIVVRDAYFIPNLMPACNCTFGVTSLKDVLTLSLGHKPNAVSENRAWEIINAVYDSLTMSLEEDASVAS